MRLLLSALVLTSFGWTENHPAAYPNETPIAIGFERGRLTAAFRSVPLHLLSERLAVVTGVKITLAEGLGNDSVSADWKDVLIADALRELLCKYDVFFFHSAAARGTAGTLRAVWVYPEGSASVLQPVPPREWASDAQLDVMMRGSDPSVRQAAWEALIGRQDPRSRGLVIDALRGISESDAGLRERLLSVALSGGFRVPYDLLGDLARGDPSGRIRWIALDALSEEPLGRRIAEGAINDPDESVRVRAMEVLTNSTRPAPVTERGRY